MDENILKFRVGIFVVIAMLILGILVFLNSEGWTRQYTVYMKPVTAPGVTVGTPVRKNGKWNIAEDGEVINRSFVYVGAILVYFLPFDRFGIFLGPGYEAASDRNFTIFKIGAGYLFQKTRQFGVKNYWQAVQRSTWVDNPPDTRVASEAD